MQLALRRLALARAPPTTADVTRIVRPWALLAGLLAAYSVYTAFDGLPAKQREALEGEGLGESEIQEIIDVTDPRRPKVLAVYDCGLAQGDVPSLRASTRMASWNSRK